MRDPKRIERILNKIKLIWEDIPDFRFGQLVYFLFNNFENQDIFFIEDDDFEKALDKEIERIFYKKIDNAGWRNGGATGS